MSLETLVSIERSNLSQSHDQMAIVSPKLRIIDSKYPGLQFSIYKFLHSSRGSENVIFESEID